MHLVAHLFNPIWHFLPFCCNISIQLFFFPTRYFVCLLMQSNFYEECGKELQIIIVTNLKGERK